MTPWALIRDARTSAGLTQQALAEQLGVTQGAVAQMERPSSNPTVARLDEVLRATGRRLDLTAAVHRPLVDETLLARNLRMSPAERLAAFETAHDEIEELRGLVRDRG